MTPSKSTDPVASNDERYKTAASLARLELWVGLSEAIVLHLQRDAPKEPVSLNDAAAYLYGGPANAVLGVLLKLAQEHGANPDAHVPSKAVMPLVQNEHAAGAPQGLVLTERVRRAMYVADRLQLAVAAEIGEMQYEVDQIRGAVANWGENDAKR
jgi:hypothetical protein